MQRYTLTPGTGEIVLTGQPVELLVFGDLKLDVGGPLFEHMATFLVAWSGLMSAFDGVRYPNFMDHVAETFSGRVSARVDVAQCIRDVRAGALKREQAEISLCSMLATVAYDSKKDEIKALAAQQPVCEFFFHVRNAAAHGDNWHFMNGQPKMRAE